MNFQFYKYHGAGNDFIVIDNREDRFPQSDNKFIAGLCQRRFGIGANGLMLLHNHSKYDFEMKYYNADGMEGSLCGNGGRCIVAFAHRLGIIGNKTVFLAIDGEHRAVVVYHDYIRLKMKDVSEIEKGDDYFFLDTGSPHYVTFTEKVKEKDVYSAGKAIRYNDRFRSEGTNVNFVERLDDSLFVRTYERGVEDETLACGTGIVASAICAAINDNTDINSYHVKALGGELKVNFKRNEEKITDIWLEGPAVKVFEGTIETESLW
ncbi:MAG: diaminopimelate epimerase [Bacteroidales bacterium]|nr:diaminopimelate epimerase [Bacteroidales bacterium]